MEGCNNHDELDIEQPSLPVLLGKRQHAEARAAGTEKPSVPTPKRKTSVSTVDARSVGLLGHMSGLERMVLKTGGALAFIQGVSIPLIALFTSESVTLLTTAEPAKVLDAMMPVLIKIGSLAVAQLLLMTCWQTALLWGAAKQSDRTHKAYLSSLLNNDIAWFDDIEPAGLASRMHDEITAVHSFMSNGLGYLALSVGQFIAGLGIALYNSWQLTLVVCAILPLLAAAGHFLGKQIERSIVGQQADFARAAAVAEEALQGIRTVAAFGAEGHELRRFEKELTAAKHGGIKAGVKMGIAWGTINCLFACLYALTFWYSSHYLVAGSLNFSGSHVIIVLIAMILGVTGLSQFSGFAPSLIRAVVAAKSMNEVLQCKVQEIECQGQHGQELPSELALIESIDFKSVSFKYPSKPDTFALRGLTFQIRKGQKVAFVGESGSGKSTTIQLLERFYDPWAGEILVNGTPLFRLPVKAWRQQIGYVGQEPVLFATSVLENLKAGDASITDAQAVEAARCAQALDFVMTLPDQLETFVGVGGGQMSGGQKQRLAIARALAKRPQILLLDEATSSLDNESERMVQSTLDSLQDHVGRNVTTVSVAHRLSTIMGSDAIFVLKEGRCCEQGSHQELMHMRGEYFKLAVSQQLGATPDMDEQELDEEQHPVQQVLSRARRSVSRAPTGSHSWLNSFTQHLSHTSGQQGDGDGMPAHSSTLLRLVRLARPEWAIFFFAFLAVILASVVVPLEALFFNEALGSFYLPSVDSMLHAMDQSCLALAILGVAALFSEMAKNGLFSYIQECLSLRMRKLAFGSIICREMAFFDEEENQTASILAALQQHMSRVSRMLGQNFANSAVALLTCISSLAFSFAGSWMLALALLGLMLVSAGFAVTGTMLAHRPSAAADHAFAVAGKATSEALMQIRTVRALGAEQHSMQIVSDSLQVVSQHNTATAWKKGLSLGFNSCLVQIIFLAGFAMSAKLIEVGGLKASDVLLTLFSVVFGLMSVTTISAYLPEVADGRHAAAEAFRLMDQVSKIDAMQPDGRHQSLGDGTISFEGVDFSYPHRAGLKVLRNLSLTVPKGQSVALVGASGSGKSTVVQLLQRFYDPQGGSIKIGGVDLRMFNVALWRRQLGVVGQEPILFDTSLEENVKYGYPEATHSQVVEAAKVANMDYVLSGEIAWSSRLGLRGEKLSGGQKQRCAIARALLRRPPILLLDEATSALDSYSERLVQHALQNARAGKTTITIAHRLSTIRGSDQIFVLASGIIKESGTYDDLMARQGIFAKLAARDL